MKWRDVTVRIEASVPEGQDEEAYRSELYGAIEVLEKELEADYNYALVREDGIRIKVSTP